MEPEEEQQEETQMPQEGFRERLGEDADMPLADEAAADEVAGSPIDSDSDYDTAAEDAEDLQHPSM